MPGVTLSTVLEPSTEEPGALTLIAQVSKKLVSGQFSADNRAFDLTGPIEFLALIDLNALTAWGDRWARPKEGSPMLFVHKSCGHRFSPEVSCSACGEAISAETVTPIPGPGGAAKTGTMVVARRLRETARSKLRAEQPRRRP